MKPNHHKENLKIMDLRKELSLFVMKTKIENFEY